MRRCARASLALPLGPGSNVPQSLHGSRKAFDYAETLLHRFKSSPDGASPEAGLVLDTAGNLYGTTVAGGADPSCPGGYDTGCGTVFEMAASGKERVLYSFAGKPDATSPFAGLLVGKQGNLFGTTSNGGNVYQCYAYGGLGCGTVFKIDASGRETLLYEFKGNFGTGKADGQGPMGGLTADAAGNLYGTTPFGGKEQSGTIFTITKRGREKVLYSFTGGPDGARPYSGVIRDSSGNLYGVAYFGGRGQCVGECGTVFELDRSGSLTILYQFKGKKDGGNPHGGLVMDAAGTLYGTAQNFGDLQCNKRGGNPGCGTVFKLDPASKKFTVLHAFAGSPDGATPNETLTIDKKGNLYGTASFGGDMSCNGGYSCGVAFEVDKSGRESLLYSFAGGAQDGEVPYGGLVRDATGNLFGTTVSGGMGPCSQGCGIVFKLTPPRPEAPQ